MKYTKNKKQIKNKSKKGGFLRTLSNMSRKAEEYGDTDFMSFVGAALSRMAYESDFSKTQTPEIKTKNFLNLFSCTMGGIIEDELLSGIGNADVSDLFNDSKIFADYTEENRHAAQGQEKSSEKKTGKFVDFKPMAEMFNILTGEELTSPTAKKLLNNGMMEAVYTVGESIKDKVYYISIGTSNYGNIYLVAHKKIPGKIFVIFRGTYSAKTAGAYTKPTSLVTWTVSQILGMNEGYLYGILKIVLDTIHTIMQGCLHLSRVAFPELTNDNSVSIITTGHSLGGAMSTIFAYLWMSIKENSLSGEGSVNKSGLPNPYVEGDFKRLNNKLCCISLGSPRVFDKSTSILFCRFVKEGFINYRRITTRGDPVPALPYFGFFHACSAEDPETTGMREKISEDCNQTLIRASSTSRGVDYKMDLDCQNYKTRTYAPDPISHTVYLDVIYTGAVDLVRFFKSPFTQNEVKRTETGSSMCRLIFYNGYPDFKPAECKMVFFNLDDVRNKKGKDAEEEAKAASEKGSSGGKPRQKGGLFSKVTEKLEDTIEDVRVNDAVFNKFLEEAKIVDFDTFDSEPNDSSKGFPVVQKSVIDELSPVKTRYFIISKMHLPSNSETPLPKGGKRKRSGKNTKKILKRKSKGTRKHK